MAIMASGLHQTKIDIPEEARVKLIKLLQARTYDLLDLQTQMKQAHWNVRGPRFIALHELFDKFFNETREFVDTVAERIGQLGGEVHGTAHHVAQGSTLPKYPTGIARGAEHTEAVASVIAEAGRNIRQAADEADQLGDKDSEDIFVEISRGLDMQLWFIESHQQADA